MSQFFCIGWFAFCWFSGCIFCFALAYVDCIDMIFTLAFNLDFPSTSQEIGWEERLQYNLFSVEWDVKLQLNQWIMEQLCIGVAVVITKPSKVFIDVQFIRAWWLRLPWPQQWLGLQVSLTLPYWLEPTEWSAPREQQATGFVLLHFMRFFTAVGFSLQCFDTVGWVFWPIKPVPDMTHNVFGGTLNLAQCNAIFTLLFSYCFT